MLAFSRVAPVPALAPAGSAQPLGKVNDNAGCLAHVSRSLSLSASLALSVLVHLWSYLLYTLESNGWVWESEISNGTFPLLPARGRAEVRKAPSERALTPQLAQGHFSRAGVCWHRGLNPTHPFWRVSLNRRSPGVIRQIHYFSRFPVFLPPLRLLLVIRL